MKYNSIQLLGGGTRLQAHLEGRGRWLLDQGLTGLQSQCQVRQGCYTEKTIFKNQKRSLYTCVWCFACMHTICVIGAYEVQKRAQKFGNELSISTRVTSAFNSSHLLCTITRLCCILKIRKLKHERVHHSQPQMQANDQIRQFLILDPQNHGPLVANQWCSPSAYPHTIVSSDLRCLLSSFEMYSSFLTNQYPRAFFTLLLGITLASFRLPTPKWFII